MNKKRKKKINTICLMTYLPWELNTLFCKFVKRWSTMLRRCVFVFYLNSENVEVDDQQQIAFWVRHLGAEGLRQQSCIKPACLFLLLYISDVIRKVRSNHAGVSRHRENIWLYRSGLLLCWHHQEFSIYAQQKIPPPPFPCHWGKYNISFFKSRILTGCIPSCPPY